MSILSHQTKKFKNLCVYLFYAWLLFHIDKKKSYDSWYCIHAALVFYVEGSSITVSAFYSNQYFIVLGFSCWELTQTERKRRLYVVCCEKKQENEKREKKREEWKKRKGKEKEEWEKRENQGGTSYFFFFFFI